MRIYTGLLFIWLALCGFSFPEIETSALPPEAHTALKRIDQSGPFPFRQDGMVFGNREKLLPRAPRGYYREYTVVTPDSRTRGARRIVTGGEPPEVFYYTDDHYRSFRRIKRP
jgi:guanyl-specific ribonuclease Sa